MSTLNLRTPTSYNGQKATTHKFGAVRFATDAEATAQVMDDVALTPQNAVLAIPAATTTVEGKVRLATNAEAVTGSLTTNVAINPGSLTARLAAPGTIGGTTPGAGHFTTLDTTTTITAGTTITATLGAITATNGNFVKGTAGNKDIYTSLATTDAAGANSAGTVTLVGGTATIATTAVTADSKIRIYRQSIGATGAAAIGSLSIGTIVAATSFVINSVSAADATALVASDVSVVFWEIVN